MCPCTKSHTACTAAIQARVTEQAPRLVHEPLRLAITASQQEHQCIVGQHLDRMLLGMRIEGVRKARVADQGVGRDADASRRNDDPGAGIAERVA